MQVLDAYIHESDQSEEVEGPCDGVANIDIDQELQMRVMMKDD